MTLHITHIILIISLYRTMAQPNRRHDWGSILQDGGYTIITDFSSLFFSPNHNVKLKISNI